MNKPSLTGKKKYHQGIFRPKNIQKYIGNPTNILYRSGWEKSFLIWCDRTPSVIAYGSEELVIPYISPIDFKQHRYFIDFFVVIKKPNGMIQKFAVEIKPYSQTRPPRVSKTKVLTESAKLKVETYMINQAKWTAARDFCRKNNTEFIILTEKELLKGK